MTLHVEPAILGPQAAEKRSPATVPGDIARQKLQEIAATGCASGKCRLELSGKRCAAMNRFEIEKDVDIQKIARIAAPDPAADGTALLGKRPTPFVMTRHHTSGAIENSGRVQNVGNMTAKRHEPGLVGRAAATVRRQNRVILIGCQQALTPCGGSQHQHSELDRRRAAVGFDHFRLRQTRRLAEGATILAADDSGYVLARHIFTGQ